jgi:hypothetical protein
MLSAEAAAALVNLENGAHFNTLHTVARELVAAGFAQVGWGGTYIEITAAGRKEVRRGVRYANTSGGPNMFDLNYDPMSNPAAPSPMSTPIPEVANPTPQIAQEVQEPSPKTVMVELPPIAPLPPPADMRDRALRAAGVASGKTGVWIEAAWLEEFINALAE